jgi:hypothetical protein
MRRGTNFDISNGPGQSVKRVLGLTKPGTDKTGQNRGDKTGDKTGTKPGGQNRDKTGDGQNRGQTGQNRGQTGRSPVLSHKSEGFL